ncbi:beta-xylosidase, partial [Mycobacterium ulcerans]
MTIFDRFNFKVVACAGLCGAAIALSPQAAAVPLKTDGYACIQGMAGEGGAPAAGGPAAAG